MVSRHACCTRAVTSRILVPLALCLGGAATAQNATIAGEPVVPEPTLHHLGILWPIEGDTDLDGVVGVQFRESGSATWRPAMPLRRVPAGSNASTGDSWDDRHAGSLFGLQPDTDYEIELDLVDPDGGSVQRTLAVRTRAWPQPGNGTVRGATPATLAAVLGQAQPGDIVELGAGSYPGFTLGRDGAAGAPLTLRGLPGSLIEGELGLFFRHDVILQSLTVQGRIRFNGSDDIAILDSTVLASPTQFDGDGIVCFLRCARAVIAGNTVIGTTIWQESAFGVDGDNRGEGIVVTGPGHAIVDNTVRGFRDGISFMEGGSAVDQYDIDVLDNTIGESADDAIEADSCARNCRIVGNILTNSFIAMSSQPGLGGPTYFVRNRAYNVVHVPFKLYRGSVGDVLLHNTVVKTGDGLNAYPGVPITRAFARNNLFLGGEPGIWAGYDSGSGRVVDLQDLQTANSSFDYNGYGTTRSDFRGRLGGASFDSLVSMRSNTSEVHGQQVEMAVFAGSPAFPQDPLLQYAPPDLALADDARAVDVGVVIPNINDGFAGVAPDLGALERTASGPNDRIFGDGFETLP